MTIGKKCIVGARYKFNYLPEFVTLPRYMMRTGQIVTVLRQCTQNEADQGNGMERVYYIQAADGWCGRAFASELENE